MTTRPASLTVVYPYGRLFADCCAKVRPIRMRKLIAILIVRKKSIARFFICENLDIVIRVCRFFFRVALSVLNSTSYPLSYFRTPLLFYRNAPFHFSLHLCVRNDNDSINDWVEGKMRRRRRRRKRGEDGH